MPIKSYLVFPQAGRGSQLLETLSYMDSCSVIPAENKEVLVLVTDTQSDSEDELLLHKLQSQKDLHHLTFVSGFTTSPV